ncbi:uncharacterized protein FIBRA_01376 [Fibroporia radiculosa]|uniref:AB hydrolase-1 domain-containing protein n=1 Tax=Fibroporia radiculosa TaxID=599839 RepID=J4G0Y4_9APHY|nr:uncharacterized protein FIBRA_01376 [Fibroporia radiculosa]CCL99358.1 predicted protein [Fibroporia radiculosa]
MEPSSYKQLITGRGFKYNYFFSAGHPSKPTILLVHGFPSTSYDWRHQVAFFRKEGFGLIVPDALGYDGTDKPSNPASYKHRGMAADLVDILIAENVDKAIAVGHDWCDLIFCRISEESLKVQNHSRGAVLVSRLANYYPERFLAFAFLAVGYSPPHVGYTYEGTVNLLTQAVGYNPFGYWQFCTEEGAGKVITDHWDSALSLIYPSDPGLWKDHLCPPGAMKAWLQAGKVAPAASYLTEQDREIVTHKLKSNGLDGGLNWYKCTAFRLNVDDDEHIPKTNYAIQQPVFYGGCKADYATPPLVAYHSLNQYCSDLATVEFNTGHWCQLEVPDEVNRELLSWIKNKVAL